MNGFVNYMEENAVLLLLLFVALVGVIVLWCLYQTEKKREKHAAAKTAGEEQFYRAFAENEKEAFFFVSKGKQELLYVSPNFERLTGVSEELFRADLEVLRKLISTKKSREITRKMEQWNGTDRLEIEADYHRLGEEQMLRAKLELYNVENPSGYLLRMADITEEHRIRQEMYIDLQKAKRESQSKTDFLSQMSHEIRTPMNGILGMLSLMRMHLSDPKTAEEYLNRTENLSQFLLTLINDILDMSRIESGKMELVAEPFDLYELADKLDAMFRGTAEAKGIHWGIQMQDFDVHDVIGDEMRLNQVIINFISNATKFTPAGGSVSVIFRQMNRIGNDLHLMIRVKDTGKGIQKDFLDKIFRPFEQEDASTAHNYGGSGLGMAIADSIVKLMNGQILVESEEGKGSEFSVYLTLPIADAVPEQKKRSDEIVHEADAERALAIKNFSLAGVRILLAEDNAINAEIAVEMLETEGAVVTLVSDGEEAVETFQKSAVGSFDAVLMDIQMPRMDGWEATKQIRKLDRADASLPIFAMSANAFLEDRRRSMEVGMNGHISKPVDYNEVRRLLGECLTR